MEEDESDGRDISRIWNKRESATAAEALQELWPDAFPSASSAKKTLRKRKSPIFVNDERVKKSQVVNFGDTITRKATKAIVVRHGGVTLETIVASTGPLVVAYLDPDVAVVVKPRGMAVTGSSTSEDTLYQKLLFCLPPTSSADPLRRPCPCHRIDKPTYGLVVVARTKEAGRRIGLAFDERRVQKRYRAIVHGKLGIGSDPSCASGHIKKDLSGKERHSEWRVVGRSWTVGNGVGGGVHLTCVDLFPHTGRVHQLRRHMKSIGHSIVGDTEYGHESADRQLLEVLASKAERKESPGKEKGGTGAAAGNGNGGGDNKDSNNCNFPSPLPLMLAAVEIQFPHKTSFAGSNTNTYDGGDGFVIDVSSNVSSDKEMLRVEVDMPPDMKGLIK